MFSRRLAGIENFWRSKSNMITSGIALVFTFGILNLILIGEWKFNANIIKFNFVNDDNNFSILS